MKKAIMAMVLVLVSVLAVTAMPSVSYAGECKTIKIYHPKDDDNSGVYHFKLKAGQETDHCIGIQPGTNIKFEVSSSDYNYYLVFDSGFVVKAGADAIIPVAELVEVKFKLRAGNTNQDIKLKVKWPFED